MAAVQFILPTLAAVCPSPAVMELCGSNGGPGHSSAAMGRFFSVGAAVLALAGARCSPRLRQHPARPAPGCGPHAAATASGSHFYITPQRRGHKTPLSHVNECPVWWLLYAPPPGGCRRLGRRRRVWSFWGRRRSRDGMQLSP